MFFDIVVCFVTESGAKLVIYALIYSLVGRIF